MAEQDAIIINFFTDNTAKINDGQTGFILGPTTSADGDTTKMHVKDKSGVVHTFATESALKTYATSAVQNVNITNIGTRVLNSARLPFGDRSHGLNGDCIYMNVPAQGSGKVNRALLLIIETPNFSPSHVNEYQVALYDKNGIQLGISEIIKIPELTQPEVFALEFPSDIDITVNEMYWIGVYEAGSSNTRIAARATAYPNIMGRIDPNPPQANVPPTAPQTVTGICVEFDYYEGGV